MADRRSNPFITLDPQAVNAAAIIVQSTKADDPALREAYQLARQAGIDLSLCTTDRPEAVDEVLTQLADSQKRTIIAAGGDGAVNCVSSAIAECGDDSLCVGVLPMGTGNDFATACGVPIDDLTAALYVALTASLVSVDLCRANDHLFINVASMGSPAHITSQIDSDSKGRFGKLAYACLGLLKANQAEAVEVAVSAGDFSWSGPSLGVLTANGREAGGGFCVATHALINDGFIDGLILPEMPARQWLTVAADMRRGQIDPVTDGLPAWRSANAQVHFEKPVTINLDGESIRGQTITFSVVPKAIRMRLPEHAPTREA